jgi:glycosyltransferase involved in cell wall biosynthesis
LAKVLDIIFVLLSHYRSYLLSRYRGADVRFVEQDLWEPLKFKPPDPDNCHVLTTGVFGTYKRLEILLDAFQILRRLLPNARLMIAGQNHPRAAGYLETLFQRHACKLSNVDYVGYVDNQRYPDVLRDSNVIALTNTTVPGSSGVIRHAARIGRGLVLPNIESYKSLPHDGWSVEFYEPNCAENLCQVLFSVLADPHKQVAMATTNYQLALQSRDELVQQHLQAFREVRRDK